MADKNIPIPRSKTQGSSIEHAEGNIIYSDLSEIGDSKFTDKGDPKKISVRLSRINKGDRKFCYRKEGTGYRFWRIY